MNQIGLCLPHYEHFYPRKTCSLFCKLIAPICRLWGQLYPDSTQASAFYQEQASHKVRTGFIDFLRKDDEKTWLRCDLKVTNTLIELYVMKNAHISLRMRGNDLELETFFPHPVKGSQALATILRAADLTWGLASKKMVVQSNCWSWGFYMKQGATVELPNDETERVSTQIRAERMLIASLAFDKIISSELIIQLKQVEALLEQLGDNKTLPLLQQHVYETYGIPISTKQDANYLALRTLEEFETMPKSPYSPPFDAYGGIEKIKLVFEEVVLDEFRKEPELGTLRKIGERHRQLVCDKLKKGLEKVFKDEEAFIKDLKIMDYK